MSEVQPPSPLKPWWQVHLWQITAVRDVAWIALAVGLVVLAYELRAVFTPVLIGLFLAYLFHPLITWLQRRYRVPRPLTSALVVAAVILIATVLAVWLGPKLIQQAVALIKSIPGYVREFAQQYGVGLEELQAHMAEWAADPGAALVRGMTMLLAGTEPAIGIVGSVISATLYLTLCALLVPIYFFFFAWEFPAIVAWFEQFIPASRRTRALEIGRKMDDAVSGFFRDRVIIGVIMAVLLAIGWSPRLADVPYWLILALVTGMLSLIPYAGLLGLALAILLKSLELMQGVDVSGGDWAWGLITLAVVYAVVQALDNFVLTPWIQGHSLNMSTVTILVIVFVGGAAGGVFGLLLCIPAAACVKIILEEVYLPKLRTWSARH